MNSEIKFHPQVVDKVTGYAIEHPLGNAPERVISLRHAVVHAVGIADEPVAGVIGKRLARPRGQVAFAIVGAREVTVPNKSTIVIGGLISDTNKRTEGGVPFLSDIPVIGYLFKDTQKSKERDELIIMIQPTVVETDADQVAINEIEKQRTILGKEAEQAAAPVTTTTTVTHQVTVPRPGLPALRTSTQTTDVRVESPAPNVVNGGLPKDAPAPPPPTSGP